MEKSSFLVLLITLTFSFSFAQSESISQIGLALKAGSAKDLSSHFSEVVEVTINGEMTKSSQNHVEILLRDFFKKFPPKDFSFTHKGSSKEGMLVYAIGSYQSKNHSFRFFMRMKEYDGKYLIYALDFTKET